MHLKNSNGFTLIEAMMAVFVIAIVMTPLFITQGSILNYVAQYSYKLERIFFAEHFLIDARHAAGNEQKFTLEKKMNDPLTHVQYQLGSVDKKSSLAKVKHLIRERVEIDWRDLGRKRHDLLVNFLYKPEEKKKGAPQK